MTPLAFCPICDGRRNPGVRFCSPCFKAFCKRFRDAPPQAAILDRFDAIEWAAERREHIARLRAKR